MKALEYLIERRRILKLHIFKNEELQEVEDAIADLEEFLKIKYCCTCKYWGYTGDCYEDNQPRECVKGISEGYCIAQTDSDFYCNKYESKESK